MLLFRDSVQLVVSDVDDTLAQPYCAAPYYVIKGLSALLERGVRIFLITGQGAENLEWRIVKRIAPELRKHILLGTCSGAEVWGYDADGERLAQPFYSVYEDAFTPELKPLWREAMADIIAHFGLVTHKTMPKPTFYKTIGRGVFDIMYEDRGPQITFEVANATHMDAAQKTEFTAKTGIEPAGDDLRPQIIAFANELFAERGIPITARKAGNIAIDFAVAGATKTTAVEFGVFSPACSEYFGLAFDRDDVRDAGERIEVWGDKFSLVNGGTDRHICEALPRSVRAIDFRREPVDELPGEFDIRIWDGERELCEGAEEYLERSGIIVLEGGEADA